MCVRPIGWNRRNFEIYGEMREREGRQEGQVATIEKLVRTGVAWTTIEAATGIDGERAKSVKPGTRPTTGEPAMRRRAVPRGRAGAQEGRSGGR